MSGSQKPSNQPQGWIPHLFGKLGLKGPLDLIVAILMVPTTVCVVMADPEVLSDTGVIIAMFGIAILGGIVAWRDHFGDW